MFWFTDFLFLDIWDTTFYKAKKLGFKVLRFDLYGRGYSDNPEIDYTDEIFAKQSLELLDSLKINKLTLVVLSNSTIKFK